MRSQPPPRELFEKGRSFVEVRENDGMPLDWINDKICKILFERCTSWIELFALGILEGTVTRGSVA